MPRNNSRARKEERKARAAKRRAEQERILREYADQQAKKVKA